MQLNHLHLRVRDVNRSRRFYEGFFGFRPHAAHEGGIVFLRDAGGLDLALAPGPDADPMPPWFHFGFRLEDAQAVRALHRRLAADAQPIDVPLTEEDGGNFVFFRLRDPDGYLIEVYWEP